MSRPAVILDLDSTLADTRQRHHIAEAIRNSTDPDVTWLHYSEAHVHDKPVAATVRLVNALHTDIFLLVLTGRDASTYVSTMKQLHDWDVLPDALSMRESGTDDYQWPVEVWKAQRALIYADKHDLEYMFAVDDWPPVRTELEKIGIPTIVPLPPGMTYCENCIAQVNR